ncbi:MAG TPA: hypothetical protein DIT99_25865 [Candidatus Latescibacteria bacterium]|nr:hypothetical protein [Candidatus Latescibacterota bacterium]
MDIVMQRRVTGWPYETPLVRACQVFCIMISGNGFFCKSNMLWRSAGVARDAIYRFVVHYESQYHRKSRDIVFFF